MTVDNPTADSAGVIRFSYSNWPAGEFTVMEDASFVPTPTPTPTPAPTPIGFDLEDVDQGGVINKVDLDSIMTGIVLYIPCPHCDINNYGEVDVRDMVLVSKKIPG